MINVLLGHRMNSCTRDYKTKNSNGIFYILFRFELVYNVSNLQRRFNETYFNEIHLREVLNVPDWEWPTGALWTERVWP